MRGWLILAAGSDVPFWDQWDGEALAIYLPWLEGRLGFLDLLRAHGEHRIALSHLLNLGLLQFNGQWDPLLQMLAGAALQASIAAGALVWLMRRTSGMARGWVLVVGALVLVFPFSWQNTLWGFQSPFFFAVGCALSALLAASRPVVGSGGWALIAAAAVLGLLSMGTAGALGAGLVAIGVARSIGGGGSRTGIALVGGGLAVMAASVGLSGEAAHHAGYRVQTWTRFAEVWTAALAWPLARQHQGWFLVLNAPLLALAWRVLTRRSAATPLTLAALGLGIWAATVGAGFALLRGNVDAEAVLPASRYLDFLVWLPLANACALAAWWSEAPERTRRVLAVAALGWVAALGVGLAGEATHAWRNVLEPRIANRDFRTLLVTRVQMTGDVSPLVGVPVIVSPSPNPAPLQQVLAEPTLRAILPPSIHPGVDLRWETGGDWLLPGRAARGLPTSGYYPYWGSHDPAGAHRHGVAVSAPFRLDLPAVEFTVAGRSPGARVEFARESDGSRTAVALPEDEGQRWRTVRVWLGAGDYRMRVVVSDDTGWLAVSVPRPVGRASHGLRRLRELGKQPGGSLSASADPD